MRACLSLQMVGAGAPYIELKRNSVQHRFIVHLVPVRLRSLVHLYSFIIYRSLVSVCDVAGSWYLKFMAGTESYNDRRRK